MPLLRIAPLALAASFAFSITRANAEEVRSYQGRVSLATGLGVASYTHTDLDWYERGFRLNAATLTSSVAGAYWLTDRVSLGGTISLADGSIKRQWPSIGSDETSHTSFTLAPSVGYRVPDPNGFWSFGISPTFTRSHSATQGETIAQDGTKTVTSSWSTSRGVGLGVSAAYLFTTGSYFYGPGASTRADYMWTSSNTPVSNGDGLVWNTSVSFVVGLVL